MPGFITEKWDQLPGVLRGAIWMVLASLFFTGLGVGIRLAARDVHVFEVVFFRNLINLLLMLPILMHIGWQTMRTEKLGLHMIRSANGVISMFFWFTAVSILPLAEATSLGFTAPLFATLGAALFLREDVRLRRWAALFIGFAGTLIILRPGLEVISTGAILMLFGSLFVAASMLYVKVLSRTENPDAMVMYMAIFVTPVSAVPMFWVWQMPEGITWLWLFIVGASATLGHLCFNRAFAATDASAVLPYDYSRLILTAVVAFLLFDEVPDIFVWIGSLVIFGSSMYIARREAVLARRAAKEGGVPDNEQTPTATIPRD